MAGYDYSLLKGKARGATGWVDANLNKATGNIVVISNEEHHSSEGTRFFYSELNTLTAGEHRQILVVTPATSSNTTLRFNIASSLEAAVELWESTAYTAADGTFVSGYNYDRTSASGINPGTEMRHTPTITASGTRLLNMQVSAGLGPQSTNDIINAPLILASGTAYLFDLRADAASTDIQVFFDWHEHIKEN